MPYNFDKDTCDICGVTKAESAKKLGLRTYGTYMQEESFQLGWNGSVLCPKCSREKQLQELFQVMDRRAAKA